MRVVKKNETLWDAKHRPHFEKNPWLFFETLSLEGSILNEPSHYTRDEKNRQQRSSLKGKKRKREPQK